MPVAILSPEGQQPPLPPSSLLLPPPPRPEWSRVSGCWDRLESIIQAPKRAGAQPSQPRGRARVWVVLRPGGGGQWGEGLGLDPELTYLFLLFFNRGEMHTT